MSKLLKNCISIDLETTGIDPNKHGVISAGVALFDSDETLYVEAYLRHGVEINKRALEVNGETIEGLKSRSHVNYVSELELFEQVAEFAEKHGANIIIGKNPEFDYGFLRAIYERAEKETLNGFPFSYRKIDWSNMAVPLILLCEDEINHEILSSDSLSRYLGLPEEEKPHNALTGAKHNVLCVKKVLKEYEKLNRKLVIKETYEIS